MSDLDERKLDHIRLCTSPDPAIVSYPADRTTLLECVELLPEGFPVTSPQEVRTDIELLGRTISAPIFVSAMTGGPEKAGDLNRDLAGICQALRIPLALGSGRPMLRNESRAPTYDVRDRAPDIPILANIGMAQASREPVDRLRWMVERIRADALVVHLNFAMEAVQPEGDSDPGPVEETIRRLAGELGHPVVVKEVGGGFTRGQVARLASTGAALVDVAGAGGASWVRIEGERGDGTGRRYAETFSRWGVPTAASLLWARGLGMENVLASGGVRTGLDVARCLALGAKACGMALPVVRAWDRGGIEGARELLDRVIGELRLAVHLCGKRSVREMPGVPRHIVPPLDGWSRFEE